MKILVCVKQVPREEDMKLDPVTKTLVRSSEGEISELDKYAIETALRLKAAAGGSITAISMGPPSSVGALRHALSMGADDAVLLSDRELGGADAYATAVTLAAGIRKLEAESGETFDLVLCGKQASDSDTSLVTPALAELLDRPHTTGLVDYRTEDGRILVTRESSEGHSVVALSYPAVCSVGKTVYDARYPVIRLKLKANRTEIPVVSLAALGAAPETVGVKGSLTTVGESVIPELSGHGMIICEENEAASAKKLAALLNRSGVL